MCNISNILVLCAKQQFFSPEYTKKLKVAGYRGIWYCLIMFIFYIRILFLLVLVTEHHKCVCTQLLIPQAMLLLTCTFKRIHDSFFKIINVIIQCTCPFIQIFQCLLSHCFVPVMTALLVVPFPSHVNYFDSLQSAYLNFAPSFFLLCSFVLPPESIFWKGNLTSLPSYLRCLTAIYQCLIIFFITETQNLASTN